MKFRRYQDDEPEVAMSPLIDCVFLLLIFFLVTTMIKRKEKQILVAVPDSTSSLSAKANDDRFIIGLDADGLAYTGNQRNERNGRILYQPIGDLAAFLQGLAARRDVSRPVILSIERETPMQQVIDAYDILQLQGFTSTSVRLKDR